MQGSFLVVPAKLQQRKPQTRSLNPLPPCVYPCFKWINNSFVLLPRWFLKPSSSKFLRNRWIKRWSRTRSQKSANYAEPVRSMSFASFFVPLYYSLKIHRKMRKPDPLDSDDLPKAKKRSSAVAVITATSYKSPNVMDMGMKMPIPRFALHLKLFHLHRLRFQGSFRPLLCLFSFAQQKVIISISSSFYFPGSVCCGDVLS